MSDIFSNLQTRVGRKIQKTDSNYKTKIKDFLNDRLQELYERYFWAELYQETSITVTASQAYTILPRGCDNVLYVSDQSNDVLVKRVGVQNFQKKYLNVLDSNGLLHNYTDIGVSPVATQLSAARTVTVESSSASDTTEKVYIRGYDANGVEVTDTLTLTGTTPVTSSNTYSAFSITNPRTGLSMVAKDGTTVGTVTVKQSTEGTTLLILGTLDRTARHKILRWQYTPNTAQTVFVGHKAPLRRFVNDGDVAQWECDSLLVQGALIDCLKEQRQFQRATLEEQKWEQLLATRMQEEERDSEENDQSMPYTEVLPIDQTRTY